MTAMVSRKEKREARKEGSFTQRDKEIQVPQTCLTAMISRKEKKEAKKRKQFHAKTKEQRNKEWPQSH